MKHKFVKQGVTKCYLLECEGGFIQIDTGYPKNYQKYKRNLKNKLNINVDEIKYLILTHHHDDHAGFATKLLEESNATLIVHEKALRYLRMGTSEVNSQPLNRRVKVVFRIFNKFHKFQYTPLKLDKNIIIIPDSNKKNEFIKDIGVEGMIIPTPGHTEDGISIILNDGSVFPGDNTMNAWYFNLLGLKKRPLFIQDFNLILKSWEGYIKLGGERIFPAHGKNFSISILHKKLHKFAKN